jgi:CHAD domain-containing protein
MRALLPLVDLETVWWPADILGEHQKTVLRVSVERSRVFKTGLRGGIALPVVVRLGPVRGHHKILKRAAAVLEAVPGVVRDECGMLESALSINGRTPLDYSSRIGVNLMQAVSAEQAVRTVLYRLLETMVSNHYGTAADIDTEFLHDFRVAVRRTRSMLGQMKTAIPPAILDSFRPEFDWLGAVTGPTRDLDVYILKFDDYAAPLDESVREELVPLRRHIVRRQRQEQLKMARAITSKRYYSLVENWRQALGETWRSEADGFRGCDTAQAVAGRQILKLFNRALSQGAALSAEAPAQAVHVLRITCKKLRYMMTFFKSLYPAAEIDAMTSPLKQLQDVLGDFQDYEVHRAELYAFAEEIAGRRFAGHPRTLVAMGRLAESLAERQAATRKDLGSLFGKFAAKRNTVRFRAFFKPPDGHAEDEADDGFYR